MMRFFPSCAEQFKLATVSKIDIRVFYTIFQAYYNYHCINKVFSNLNVKALVVSHYVGIKSGIYTRCALAKGVQVLNRVGSHQIIIKKFNALSQQYEYPLRPELKYCL